MDSRRSIYSCCGAGRGCRRVDRRVDLDAAGKTWSKSARLFPVHSVEKVTFETDTGTATAGAAGARIAAD
jgi:hypothetical protein